LQPISGGHSLTQVGSAVERNSLGSLNWNLQPSLDKSLVFELARRVRGHDDLVITGNSGTGKRRRSGLPRPGVRARAPHALRPLRRFTRRLSRGLADGTDAGRLKG
jgi:hypothetical protein